MAGKRWSRFRQKSQGVIPLQNAPQLSRTVSLWYCDFKITVFNDLIFGLGCKYRRLLRLWFTIGTAINIVTVVGVSLMLLWEFVYAPNISKHDVGKLLMDWLFGLSHFSGLRMSVMDFGIMLYSTIIAVGFHEFGHALAAASQGIQIEYVALFLAVIFPGAFVAFNYDLLQNLSLINSLRIYCAGIWHNFVLCAGCWLTLLLLPYFLCPFYVHGEGSMVLNVASVSPLSGYLSEGDIIVSLDGKHIHHPQEWVEKLVQMDRLATERPSYEIINNSTLSATKGYCVPNSKLENSIKLPSQYQNLFCPNELSTFVSLHCPASSLLDEDDTLSNQGLVNIQCLAAKDIVKLKKCGYGWKTSGNDISCSCQEDESCMTPVETPGTAWIEISFYQPYSSECLKNDIEQSLMMSANHSTTNTTPCGGAFVFIGSPLSLTHSLTLSAYRPRRKPGKPGKIALHLPAFLERVLSLTFHVSTSLALFNSLPVFFLDGESILETFVLQLTCLKLRTRRRILRLVLYGGSVLFIFTSFRIFTSV